MTTGSTATGFPVGAGAGAAVSADVLSHYNCWLVVRQAPKAGTLAGSTMDTKASLFLKLLCLFFEVTILFFVSCEKPDSRCSFRRDPRSMPDNGLFPRSLAATAVFETHLERKMNLCWKRSLGRKPSLCVSPSSFSDLGNKRNSRRRNRRIPGAHREETSQNPCPTDDRGILPKPFKPILHTPVPDRNLLRSPSEFATRQSAVILIHKLFATTYCNRGNLILIQQTPETLILRTQCEWKKPTNIDDTIEANSEKLVCRSTRNRGR